MAGVEEGVPTLLRAVGSRGGPLLPGSVTLAMCLPSLSQLPYLELEKMTTTSLPLASQGCLRARCDEGDGQLWLHGIGPVQARGAPSSEDLVLGFMLSRCHFGILRHLEQGLAFSFCAGPCKSRSCSWLRKCFRDCRARSGQKARVAGARASGREAGLSSDVLVCGGVCRRHRALGVTVRALVLLREIGRHWKV